MPSYEAGSVFTQIIPSFRGAQTLIARHTKEWGDTIRSGLSDAISDSVPEGLKDGSGKAQASAKAQGSRTGKTFGDSFKARVKAAFESLPEAEPGLDASRFDKKLAYIRKELQSLSAKEIGVDIDATTAERRLKQLQAELTKISSKAPNIQVKVDAARATQQLAALRREAAALDGKEIDVGVDKRGLSSFRMASSGAAGLTSVIGGLGALAVPALAAATAGAVALGGAFAAAGVGVAGLAAVAVPAFSAVSEASKAQDAMNKAISTYGAGSTQAVTATKKYQAAMASLTPAQRELAGAMDKAKAAFKSWREALEPKVLPVFTRAIGLLKPILNGLSPVVKGAAAGMNTFLTNIGNVINSPWFARMSQVFGNLARTAIPLLGTAFTNLFQGLGNLFAAFRPLTTFFLQGLANMTGRFKAWSASLAGSNGFKQFVNFVKTNGPKLMSMLGAIGRAFVAIMKALAPIGAALVPVVTGFMNFIAAVPSPVLTAIAVAIGVITIAMWALNSAFLANPITWIILAIVAAVGLLTAGIYYLVTNWTTVWNTIKSVALTVWNALKTAFWSALNFIKTVFWTVINAIKTAWSTAWNWVKNTAISIWNAIRNFFVAAWNYFKAAWSAVWNDVVGVFRKVWNWIKDTAMSVWGAIKFYFTTKWNQFIGFFKWVWNTVKNYFAEKWQQIKDTAKAVWGAIKFYFTSKWNQFIGFFKWVWNTIKARFKYVWDRIKSTARSVWDSIAGFFRGAFDKFTGFFKGVWNKISGFFEGVWEGMVRTARGIWDKIKAVVAKPINFVINTVLNGGLFKAWNGVADFLGLDSLKIKPLSPVKFATGGVLPGYAPGHDTVPAMLSPGEAVLTPGAASALGHSNILALNAMFQPGSTSHFAKGGIVSGAQHFADGGIVGWAKGLWNGAKNVFGGIKDFFTNPVKNVKKLLKNSFLGDLKNKILRTTWGKTLAGFPKKMVGGLVEKVKKFFSNMFGGGSKVAGARPATQWRGTALRALSMLGLPLKWVGRVLKQINIESGGNPNIVNTWDSNAAAGHPSIGLLQTIGPTFRSYAYPGHGNIRNPLDNILAAIRYAMSRYHSIPNIWPTRAGYEVGTPWVPEDQLAYLHRGEAVIPAGVNARLQSTGTSRVGPLSVDGLTASGNGVTQNVVTNVYPQQADPNEVGASVSRYTARRVKGLAG